MKTQNKHLPRARKPGKKQPAGSKLAKKVADKRVGLGHPR